MKTPGVADLLERCTWVLGAYKRAGEGYARCSEAVLSGVSLPRSSSWRSDKVIPLLVKVCDAQALAMQGMHQVAEILAGGLEAEIEALRLTEGTDTPETQSTPSFSQLLQMISEGTTGCSPDPWREKMEIRKKVRACLDLASEKEKIEKEKRNQCRKKCIALLQTYTNTQREYIQALVGHLGILMDELRGAHEEAEVPAGEKGEEEKEQKKQQEIDSAQTAEPSGTLSALPDQEILFLEALKQSNKYPSILHATVEGCGVFYIDKISRCIPFFLVYTSAMYVHGFSITDILARTTADIFMRYERKKETGAREDLLQDEGLEELNKYLLQHIEELAAVTDVFPLFIPAHSVRLHGKEIHIEARGMFGRKTKVKGVSPQQVLRFYSLLRQKVQNTASVSASSTPNFGVYAPPDQGPNRHEV